MRRARKGRKGIADRPDAESLDEWLRRMVPDASKKRFTQHLREMEKTA